MLAKCVQNSSHMHTVRKWHASCISSEELCSGNQDALAAVLTPFPLPCCFACPLLTPLLLCSSPFLSLAAALIPFPLPCYCAHPLPSPLLLIPFPLPCCCSLQGDRHSVSMLIQLKLHPNVKNDFEHCEVHIPFFHRCVRVCVCVHAQCECALYLLPCVCECMCSGASWCMVT